MRTRRLSDVLGTTVIGPGGERVGKVADLAASLADAHPLVTHLAVRGRWYPWSAVQAFDSEVRLRDTTSAEPPRGLLLGRHVLDSQVVDLDGKRLRRVGTSSSSRTPASSGWSRSTSERARSLGGLVFTRLRAVWLAARSTGSGCTSSLVRPTRFNSPPRRRRFTGSTRTSSRPSSSSCLPHTARRSLPRFDGLCTCAGAAGAGSRSG